MLDPRLDRFVRFAGWLVIIGLTPPSVSAQPAIPNPFLPLFPEYARLMEAAQPQPFDPPKPFAVPKNRVEWDAQRPALLMQVGGEFEKTFPDILRFTAQFGPAVSLMGHPHVVVEPIQAVSITGRESTISGQFLRPTQPGGSSKLPLVVLLVDPCPAGALATTPGWDGRAPALVLTEMGFAVLIFDHARLSQWFAYPFPMRAALDVVLTRPEIDPAHVGVLGLGKTGMTALTLMARDPRVNCGIVAIESREAITSMTASIGGHSSAPLTTHYQELAALCAPRPLCLMIGEPLPLPPAAQSAGKRLERAAKGTYKVYGKEGNLSFTHYGEFGEYTSVSTRLQWMAGLEWLDKHFRPQGPTPLGHAAEPEPTLDPGDKDVLNLTEHGIAGWAPEMSGRDSTWSWKDGVVACQPKGNEYGWLRAPVAVADYLLQIEWKVPSHGNAGIFMRAQPVTWFLPPTEENKFRISTLGLTWPSRTGLELQTQDDPGNADRYSTGSLYRHAAPASNPTHSPDQWNRSTVRARGTRIEVWNNGEQVLDADLTRSADTLPNPPLAGYIGLQNHNAPAEYRNVRLKRLTPEPQPALAPVQKASTD